MMDLIRELAAQSDVDQDVAVDVYVGTRQIIGTIDDVRTEPTFRGLEYKVDVDIGSSTITCSPGMLRLA